MKDRHKLTGKSGEEKVTQGISYVSKGALLTSYSELGSVFDVESKFRHTGSVSQCSNLFALQNSLFRRKMSAYYPRGAILVLVRSFHAPKFGLLAEK